MHPYEWTRPARPVRTWILLVAGPVTAILLPSSRASAQERTTVGAVEDYLMDEAYEVALARSAAPAVVSDDATVLVFGADGYREARAGTNGFTCLVERSWSSPFGPHGDFYNPRLRAPICFNPVAARANLREYLRRTALALEGKTWREVQEGVARDIASGALRPPDGLGMSYMMSDGQLLGTRTGRFQPHVMFYAPYTDGTQIGADSQNPHAMIFEYEGGPYSAIIVPVDEWIPAPAAPEAGQP